MFRLVVCPNYGFEIIGWALFALLTNPFYNKNIDSDNRRADFVYFCVKMGFCLVGAVQMFFWARGKQRRNKKLFDEKYNVKKLLLPFIV